MDTFRSFIKESPDYNFMLLEGHIERIAANRVVLCTITEFGIMNDRRMTKRELLSFLNSIQITIGDFTIVNDNIQKPCILLSPAKPFTFVQSGETAIEGMA